MKKIVESKLTYIIKHISFYSYCIIVSAIMDVSSFRVVRALMVNAISPLANNYKIYTKELILPLFVTSNLFVNASHD